MKIKGMLVRILVMALLIGTGFSPVTEVYASATDETQSTYLDYLTTQVKAGYYGYYGGIVGRFADGATLYDSSKYNKTPYSFVNTPKRQNELCTDAYDMITIASKYSTVLAFGHYDADDTIFDKPAVGYTSDGTAEIIYDVDGYDALGYDKDGYNVLGYDKDGYDRDGYNRSGRDRNGYDKDELSINKIVANRDESGKISIVVLNNKGYGIDPNNYKFSVKAISARKGCGTYEVTVKFNEKYGNKVLTTTTITLIPSIHARILVNCSGYSSDSKYYTGKNDCLVMVQDEKSTLKYCDGIQYVIGKDKGFKKIYAKNSIKLKKYNKYKYQTDKEFKVKDGSTCYIKYRVYTVVNGKKIYSEWHSSSSKMLIG